MLSMKKLKKLTRINIAIIILVIALIVQIGMYVFPWIWSDYFAVPSSLSAERVVTIYYDRRHGVDITEYEVDVELSEDKSIWYVTVHRDSGAEQLRIRVRDGRVFSN